MPSPNIAEKIEQFLKCDTSETTLDQHGSAEYQAQFSDEGARKAAYIVNDLQQNSIATGEALDNFCYLSIGGADGSEIEAILRQTDIRYGILIEKSNDARRAAERRKKTLEKTGRHLFLYTGDATQSLVDDALPMLQSLKKNVGISGVVVSMQAVIHELPTRSPAFKSLSGQDEVFYFNNFIAKCFKNFEKRAFYCREPTPPDNWPDFVELRIPSVAGDRLTVFSSFIAQKLGLIDTLPEEFPDDFVQMPKTLALEVVQKLRCPNVSRFKFELGERLTTYAASELQSIIDKFLPHGNAVLEPHVSDGFKAFWGQLGIEARSTKGQGQPIPSTHARIMSLALPDLMGFSYDKKQ